MPNAADYPAYGLLKYVKEYCSSAELGRKQGEVTAIRFSKAELKYKRPIFSPEPVFDQYRLLGSVLIVSVVLPHHFVCSGEGMLKLFAGRNQSNFLSNFVSKFLSLTCTESDAD